MKRVLLLLVCVVATCSVAAAQPVTESLREQLSIHREMLRGDMQELEDQRALTQEAWIRVERGVADLNAALRGAESLESLRLRDEDLRQAESELLMQIFATQRVRRDILEGEALIAATEEQIRRLGDEVGPEADPLTGAWSVVMEPGGLQGRLQLRLDGTLLSGTYRLDGDWSGSLRGTFVSGKVRMERIDSQIGFAATYYGQLIERGGVVRIEGNWEATQLAAGMPSGGSWMAVKLDETVE
jgi:hypothetical protein